jgi:phosphatidyl-myo-inositol dimannoside synthase
VSGNNARIFLGATLLEVGSGGIAAVARMTARALVDAGARVDLLSYLDQEPINVSSVQAHLAQGSKVKYLLKANRFVLANQFAVYDSIGAARAHPRAFRMLRPYATWIFGIDAWYGMSTARRRTLEASDLVLASSAFTLSKFESLHWGLPKAKVCWLSTENDDEPSKPPLFQGAPQVLILGRIDKGEYYKGHHELIAAWPKVVAAIPEARLVIAGGGSGLDAIKSLASSSPVAPQIDVLGFVPEADIAALWQSAHVFAMPSRNEGFGLVYAEAMRYGLPVIASVHDAGNEVNADGVTGFNVDLDRADDLTEKLIFLLEEPDKARAMGQAGRQRWREHFRYSAFARRFRQSLTGYIAFPPGNAGDATANSTMKYL